MVFILFSRSVGYRSYVLALLKFYMLMKTYNIDSTLIKNLFKNIINKSKNSEAIIDILLQMLTSESISHILALHSMDEKYQGFDRYDVVRVPMIDYHIDEKFHIDVLYDLGLIPEPNKVYGVITGDGGYGSDFNPYHPTMRVDLVYHDENKRPQFFSTQVNSLYLSKDNKAKEILSKYHKDLQNGQDQ